MLRVCTNTRRALYFTSTLPERSFFAVRRRNTACCMHATPNPNESPRGLLLRRYHGRPLELKNNNGISTETDIDWTRPSVSLGSGKPRQHAWKFCPRKHPLHRSSLCSGSASSSQPIHGRHDRCLQVNRRSNSL